MECEKLKQITGFTDKDITDSFSISDDGVNWVLKIKWMEQTFYKKMMEYKDAVKGRYVYSEKEKFSTFIIPKSQASVTPFVISTENQLRKETKEESEQKELDQDTVELLKRSVEQQGQLLPIVKDQKGYIISGRHRKAADPNWREMLIITTDELDRLLKIIHFNVQRRPSREETAKILLRIAEILESKGIKQSDIAVEMSKIVPYSDQWIRELLPDKYKHVEFKSEPKVVSPRIESQETIQPKSFYSVQEGIMAELVMCEGCGSQVHRSRLQLKGGKLLCPKCRGEKPKVEVKPQVKEYKPKETGEFRRAQMHPAVSNMDVSVLEELKQRGHKVEFQVRVPLVETVIDFVVDNVPFYLDGKWVHLHRDWKDDVIREKLSQKFGRTVYAIEYEQYSKRSVKENADAIEGALQ